MLLSYKYNFLFVHIAKTGGTSIRTALSALRWRDPIYYLMWPAHKISGMCDHKLGLKFPRHAHAIAAQEMLPKEYFEQLFKFAFVRNPWDLQVSSFYHIKRERPQLMNGISQFNEFMRWKFSPERPYQYHIDTSLSLQSDYLVDLHENILVDFIGRYENLDQDFQQVCKKLSINASLPHKRKSLERQADYRSYYEDDTIELVTNHFSKDIKLLGYSFEDNE